MFIKTPACPTPFPDHTNKSPVLRFFIISLFVEPRLTPLNPHLAGTGSLVAHVLPLFPNPVII